MRGKGLQQTLQHGTIVSIMFWDSIIIGGGAAGFFAGVTLQRLQPAGRFLLLERTNVLLTKVRISGGGRCNVTHHCFEPRELVRHYPRGSKELLGAFSRFQPKDTMAWFQQRGVALVTEKDGRVFPSTHSSETIAQTLLEEARQVGLNIRTQVKIQAIEKTPQGFLLRCDDGEVLEARTVILATGGSKDGHQWAKTLGHRIEPPVPSLFTFNCPQSRLKHLSGVTLPSVRVSLPGTPYGEEGPLLITHFGFSGPAVLRMSAFAARWLAEHQYRATLQISWLPGSNEEEVLAVLREAKEQHPKKGIPTWNPFHMPASLWEAMAPAIRWQDLSKAQMRELAGRLLRDTFQIDGKTTHKEEFVTCGGVALEEVQFKTMESRKCPGLFFAGEVLDIDGVTGGFNFQNAWTTGYGAAHGAQQFLKSPSDAG
jgi:predicted Rossmann fold flavoprotein